MNTLVGKKIKMAQVITRLDWSGAPDIIEIICSRLDHSIYDVALICGPTRWPTAKTKEFLKRFVGRSIIVPSLKRNINLIDDLASLLRLYIIFSREKFDIVHTHTAKAGFIGRIAARLAGARLIVHTPHGHDFYGYFGSVGSGFIVILERIAAAFADKIAVLTEIEKRDMLRYRICHSCKIEVVKSGMDFSAFDNINVDVIKKKAEFNIAPDDFVVGTISRLESIKGIEYFIDSAKIVLEAIPRAIFLVVGEGSLRSSLEERARRLGIGKRIIFAGWREDVPEIMPILDVLVLSSLNEAVGRVILEAGAAGKPVIATAVGGVPEIVKNGDTGVLVPPMNPERIARAVVDLLRNEERKNSMGRSAREWIRNNFDEKKMVEGMNNIYRELAKR